MSEDSVKAEGPIEVYPDVPDAPADKTMFLPGGTRIVLPQGRTTISAQFFIEEEPDQGYVFLAEYPEDADDEDLVLRKRKLEQLKEAVEECIKNLGLTESE